MRREDGRGNVNRASPVGRAIWFIETHFDAAIDLDEIAAAAGVSRFHLSRVFGLATGRSVQGYLRGRRLSEAARALAQGAPDILAVALDAGYGSHEAFTRAFGEQFGLTPEALRAQRTLDGVELVQPIPMAPFAKAPFAKAPSMMAPFPMEPLTMDPQTMDSCKPDDSLRIALEEPRLETRGMFLVAGLGERYDDASTAGIPAQWQRFAPHIGHIPGQIGEVTYGVLCNGDDQGRVEYVTGVEVRDFAHVPRDWSRVRIPEQTYVVFRHREHISQIRGTWFTILNRWFPESGRQPIGGTEFERYGPEFDPATGRGGLEIWIPIRP